MKNTFFEYYPTNKDAIDEIWNNCIFSYDANVLLNLYRYSTTTRKAFFEIIKALNDNTILPYHSGYEYHKNRRKVIKSQKMAYDKIEEIINSSKNKFITELNTYRKHCLIETKEIIDPVEKTLDKIIKKLKEQKEKHDSLIDNDSINEMITNLFEGKLSDFFLEEELKEIYKEGKSRYEKKIPPGFADFNEKKNDPEESLYGDLIIWKHLIKISKEKQKNIVFVTDDRKDDWWFKDGGETIGAHPVLYREFFLKTEFRIMIYNAEQFIKFASDYAKVEIEKDAVSEISELRKQDEIGISSTKEQRMREQQYINRLRRQFLTGRRIEEPSGITREIFDYDKNPFLDRDILENTDSFRLSKAILGLGRNFFEEE